MIIQTCVSKSDENSELCSHLNDRFPLLEQNSSGLVELFELNVITICQNLDYN